MLRNFSFIIDGVLAGSGYPGPSPAELMKDLERARAQGITAIVTLTETPLPLAVVQESGMKYLHLPIHDFSAPTIDQIRRFVEFVDKNKSDAEEGGATLAHCHAGIGRTGTMLAAYLIHQGADAESAIATVRRRRPGSIETMTQEDLLAEWEKIRRS